jgi:tetratricopeptide (TPR) repeat protein
MPDTQREELAKLEALYAGNPEGRVFTHLAEAYRRAGELYRAKDIVEAGLHHHPDYASAHVVHGRLLNDLGDADAAAGAFRRVLDLDAANRTALHFLAAHARDIGDRDDAIHRFEQLAALDPGDQDVRDELDRLRAAPAPAHTPGPAMEDAPDLRLDWAFGTGEAGADAEPADEGLDDFAPIDVDFALGSLLEGDDPGLKPVDVEPAEKPHEDAGPAWPDPAAGDGAHGLQAEAPTPDADEAAAQEGTAWPPHAAAQPSPDTVPEEQEAEADFDPAFDALPAPGEFMPDEVMTETLAELYASQGFPERAREVYRVLVAARPDDEWLRLRLAELDEVVAADRTSAHAVGEAHASEPSASAVRDAWQSEADEAGRGSADAESQEPADDSAGVPDQTSEEAAIWIAGGGGAEAGETPYAWREAEMEPEGEGGSAGVAVGSYFERVLGFTPRSGVEELLLEEVAEEPEGMAGAEAAEAEAAPAGGEPWLEAPEEPGSEPAEGPAWWEAAEALPVPETSGAEEEGGWGLPPEAELEEAGESASHSVAGAAGEEGRDAPSGSERERATEPEQDPAGGPESAAAGGGEGGGAAAEAEAEPMPWELPARAAAEDQTAERPAEDAAGAPEPGEREPDRPTTTAGSSGGEEEDEDLEMFRAWLESLRK